jgi:hypothetical protein
MLNSAGAHLGIKVPCSCNRLVAASEQATSTWSRRPCAGCKCCCIVPLWRRAHAAIAWALPLMLRQLQW